MLRLAEIKNELKVVSDQHGIPTSCIDFSIALGTVIDKMDDFLDRGENILHLSNSCEKGSITWAEFAREIFLIRKKDVKVADCTRSEYPTKARRPEWSILENTSDIILPDWKSSLADFLCD
jgi:dTDP-4-dehydrorhamnose reductase